MCLSVALAVGENRLKAPDEAAMSLPKGEKSMLPFSRPACLGSAMKASRLATVTVACIASVVPARRPASAPASGSPSPSAKGPATVYSNDFEIIIVGSGFGGAATACRLAQAGRQVRVLESGGEGGRRRT